MQNVILPDAHEVDLERTYSDLLPPVALRMSDGRYTPEMMLALARAEVAELKAFVRALYAKHGEECPLFKEEE